MLNDIPCIVIEVNTFWERHRNKTPMEQAKLLASIAQYLPLFEMRTMGLNVSLYVPWDTAKETEDEEASLSEV